MGLVAGELARLDQEAAHAERAAQRWEQTAARLDAQRATHRAGGDQATAKLRTDDHYARLRAALTG